MLAVTLDLLADIGGWPLLKEARACVSAGRVLGARREGDVLRGQVKISDKVHQAEIRLAALVSKVEVSCSCPDHRKSGRVCLHIMAVGATHLPQEKVSSQSGSAGAVRTVPSSSGVFRSSTLLPSKSTEPKVEGPKRYILAEAPGLTAQYYVRVLLPMSLPDSLRQESMRVILEARQDDVKEAKSARESRPWAVAMSECGTAYAVLERDEEILSTLIRMTSPSSVSQGVAMVPKSGYHGLLQALADHPDVWLGKKQSIKIHAVRQRPVLIVRNGADGSLEIIAEAPSSQSSGNRSGTEISLPGGRWFFDGTTLSERMHNAALFSKRVARGQIPAFLTQEWPTLAASYEVKSSDITNYSLEIGVPEFLIKLDGALSGLTLELEACYSGESFTITAQSPVGGESPYYPDPVKPTRFWRRDFTAEQATLRLIDQTGFRSGRAAGQVYSMTSEKQVAEFLANVLPKWKRQWRVIYGSRLENTLREVDLAEPEFTLRPVGSGEDWLSLDLKLTVGGKPVPIDAAEVQRWLQTGRSHGKTPNRRTLLIPTEAWKEMQEVLVDSSVRQEPGGMRIPKNFAPFLSSALQAQGFRANDLSGMSEGVVEDLMQMIPSELWSKLRPYQQQGATWLAGLAQRNMSGLLADDMGLGKTVQTLVFCAWLHKKMQVKEPMLVVCPTSLVINWQREAARFVPELRCTFLTGSDRADRLAKRKDFHLLITSYAILRRDIETYAADQFSVVVLDEAQHIKNRSSQNAQAAKSLKADHRVILTGTPLENSILDLWSLYDFLLPGYLGTAKEFQERYETPLSKGQPDAKLMERLRHRVRPFFLRRTKEQVLTELPPKQEYLTYCELSAEQREVYRAVLAQGRKDVFDSAGKSGQKKNRLAILTTLLRLRQVCCHLDLLPDASGEKPGLAGSAGGDRVSKWSEPSSKMERTYELLDEAMDGGHRVLVFSQFVQALHLLRDEATRRKIPFCYLDGETVHRQKEVDRFQKESDVPLFFISLKAGGTGLNLTGADTVIHFDPWWNPAVEEQATARAHRMGQERTVQAYKLIAAGTVEEKIQALQARKRELFAASVGDEVLVDSLSAGELEELLAD